ncbi:MAG: hypothetical protein MI924_12235 [Chloroflexales bacterium]|nr:hypothetical protein [Chloroflexales bacterium]
MIETQTRTSPIKTDAVDLPNALLKLSREGWKPALFESQRNFLTLAGVSDQLLTIPIYSNYRRLPTFLNGDIFFKDSDLYYLVLIGPGNRPVLDRSGRIVRLEENNSPILELGVISNSSPNLDDRLLGFINAVEDSIKSSLDGRKARHINFEWRELKPRNPGLERIMQSEGDQGELTLNGACVIEEELQAAKALTSKTARETLIELSQAVFVRERDFFGRKTKNQDEVRAAIEALRSANLINVEHLLECKRSGAPLTRIKDINELKSAEVSELVCGSCGKTFEHELISEGYSLSDLGRKMSRQSYWMTVWVTELLVRLGVPQESILWNVSEAGDEVDILVGFLGQIWIFELKDREFGSGDAYPLNYRQVRYRANKAIIITTDRIARDAKKVFEEVLRDARRPERSGPVYIEGLEAAEGILREELSEAALGYASQRISMLGEMSGYDLATVLASRFGGQIKNIVELDSDISF